MQITALVNNNMIIVNLIPAVVVNGSMAHIPVFKAINRFAIFLIFIQLSFILCYFMLFIIFHVMLANGSDITAFLKSRYKFSLEY